MPDTISYERVVMNKRAILAQIWIPLIIGIILVGVMAYFLFDSAASGSTQLSQWSDISLIFLLVPIIGFSLLALIIGIFCVFFTHAAHKQLQVWLETAASYTTNWNHKIRGLCQKGISLASGPSEWLKNSRRKE